MNAASRIDVDPGNLAALDAWNGPDGDYWAANAETFDASLARYRQPFLDSTRIGTADHVLDIGCGNGQSTLDAARLATDGRAVGVDLSARMLDVARRRAAAEQMVNVDFLRADAQIHPFDQASFDAAISHTGAMFFGDPAAAFANIARALRSRAPFTLLVWQPPQANGWFHDLTASLTAGRQLPAPAGDGPGPFSLADPAHARGLLETTGFTDVAVDGVREPMWFGDTPDDALGFIAGLGAFAALLRDLEPDTREAALARLRDNIDAHHTAAGVQYPSAMWLITATRQPS